MSLAVSEIFGPTFQGEGPSLGRRAGFVRLGRCNLDCGAGEGASWACDTPYTWDWKGKLGHAYDPATEVTVMEEDQIAEQLVAMDVPLVVLTGGEPMLQARALHTLVEQLPYQVDVEIETNGTLAPPDWMRGRVAFNVSPKLANSGVDRERAWKPLALDHLARLGARFKFVCAAPDDLLEVDALVELIHLVPDAVWIMPAGTSAEVVEGHLLALADAVLERGYNLTTRLHVQLWGDRRGV